MKKLFHIFIFLLILRGLPITALSQTTNLSELSDEQIVTGLVKHTIEHSEVPFERNESIYKAFEKYFYNFNGKKKEFNQRFPKSHTCDYLSIEPGFVEIEEHGDILTWPIHARLKYSDYDVVFYTDKVSPNGAFATSTTIFGNQYSTVQAKMNMMKVGNKTKPIIDVLKGVDFHNALIMHPINIVRPIGVDYFLLGYSVTYAQKPTDIIYTPPAYISVAGQLLQVDDGVHYEVPLHDVGYLSLINPNTMSSDYTIVLDGIEWPILYSFSSYTFTHFYCVNRAIHELPSYYHDKKYKVFSKEGTPIYILSRDCRELITKLIPGDGDIVFDMAETADYIIYCGSNKKHGYVGFDNPVLVIIDKKTNEEVVRYSSRLGSKRKGVAFTSVLLLPAPNKEVDIYLTTDGVKKDQYGKQVDVSYTEVVSLSSLLNK